MALLTRVLVALSICALLVACGRAPDPNYGRDIDSLEIFRPALSPDGRFMVFDFYEYAEPRGGQLRVTPNHLALYDIEAQSVAVMAPNDPIYSYNSASFVGDERMLVAIQHCWSEACLPEDLGHQIVLLDLEGQRSRRLTDGRKPSYLWRLRSSEPTEKEEQRIFRTRPIFVPSEFAIYYMGFPGYRETAPAIGEQWPVSYQLLRVDLETGEESLAMTPEHGPVVFGRYGRVAQAGDRRLVFSGSSEASIVQENPYRDIRARAFFFDIDSRTLTPLFPDPPYFDNSSERSVSHRFTFSPLSLTSSADGKRIAFIDFADGPEFRSVWLREDGATQEPLELETYGINVVSAAALSADGRWLAILDLDDNRRFLLMDLDSGQVRQLPLQLPLRQAIEEAKRNTQVRVN